MLGFNYSMKDGNSEMYSPERKGSRSSFLPLRILHKLKTLCSTPSAMRNIGVLAEKKSSENETQFWLKGEDIKRCEERTSWNKDSMKPGTREKLEIETGE